MPRYEFRCRECSTTFELSRPMAAAQDAAQCPSGHDDTVRLLSTVALSVGSLASASMSPTGRAASPPGGCCGGGCCG
ncbi:MAG: FmdB family zinc ribbon protein [Pseudonocardiaceae bacterium]